MTRPTKRSQLRSPASFSDSRTRERLTVLEELCHCPCTWEKVRLQEKSSASCVRQRTCPCRPRDAHLPKPAMRSAMRSSCHCVPIGSSQASDPENPKLIPTASRSSVPRSHADLQELHLTISPHRLRNQVWVHYFSVYPEPPSPHFEHFFSTRARTHERGDRG